MHASPADVIDVEHPNGAPAEVGGRSFVHLAGAAVTISAALTVVGLLVTITWADTWLGRWDRQVVASLANARSAAVNDAVAAISALSGTTTVIGVALTAGVLTLAATRSWRPMLFITAALVGEVLLYLVISQIVGRTRPAVPDLTTGLPTGASWPSGHAAAATVLYGALAALLYRFASSPSGGPLLPGQPSSPWPCLRAESSKPPTTPPTSSPVLFSGSHGCSPACTG